MKLPQQVRTGTPHMVSVSPQAYGAAGNAWSRAFQSLGANAKQIADTHKQFQINESKTQGINAQTRVITRMADWDGQYSNVPEYQNSEIPGDIRAQFGLKEGEVSPAYITKAFWRDSQYQQIIREESLSVKDSKVRNNWVASTKNTAARENLRFMVERSGEQVDYTDAATQNNIDQLVADQDYSGAYLQSQAFSTKDKRTDAQMDITTVKQKFELNAGLEEIEGQTNTERIGMLTATLDSIYDNDYNMLSPSEQKAYENAYKSAIKETTRAMTAKITGVDKMNKYRADQLISNMGSNQAFDIEQYTGLIEYFTTTEELVEVEKLEMANRLYLTRKDIFGKGTPLQVLRNQKAAKTQGLSAEEGAFASDVFAAATKELPLFLNTPVDYIEKWSVVDLEPVRMDKQGSLTNRFKQISDAEGILGFETRDILTSSELAYADNLLINGSTKDILNLSIVVQDELGDDAYLLFDQMQMQGKGGAATIASQYALEGQRDLAENILEGRHIQQTTPNILLPDERQDLNDELVEKLYGVYVTPEQRSLATEAAFAMAYYLKDSTGDFDSDTIITLATGGGIVTYEGAAFQAPKPGITTGIFENWMDRLSLSYFENINSAQVQGQRPGTIAMWTKAMLDRGVVQLKPTGLRGEWFLYDTRTRSPLRDTQGSLAKLRYDANARTMKQDKALTILETGAQGAQSFEEVAP